MGEMLRSRRGITVTAGQNVFGTSLIVPDPRRKLVFTIVPQLAGVLSLVRLDGTTTKVSKLFDGDALIALTQNKYEFMAPKFYSFIPDEIAYNFRYSVSTTFDIITVYAEFNHAAVLAQ